VTVYDNSSCLDSGQPASYALDSCQQYSTTINFGSLLVELQPPAPECIWHTPDVGDASLTGVETICCK